jgi:hypothetical protein
MLSLAKKILMNYKSLMVQMFEKHVAHDSTKANLELLCDIEVFIGLTCIIPMFECVQSLSKFAQTCDAFICDFVAILKSCVEDLYCMYCNEQARYGLKDFNQFLNTIEPTYVLMDVGIISEQPIFLS